MINLDAAEPRNPAHGSLWREGDIRDQRATNEVVRAFDPTDGIDLAARTDLEERPSDYSANTAGTRNLLAALGSVDPAPRLVAASTRLVCRSGYQPSSDHDYCPPNAYGESKVEMEKILRDSGYPGAWSLVRPTGIWGPWFGTFREFFIAVARGRYRHPAGADVVKSLGYVENTAHQIDFLLAAPEADVHSRVFYLADYEPVSIEDWAGRIQAATGGPAVKTASIPLLRVAATAGDALKLMGWKQPPLTRFRLRNMLTDVVHDTEPIRRVVPELPFSLDAGVVRTAEWLRASGALNGRPAAA